jgi:RimJ/RimL family protein N-acetyltransferase
VRFGAEKVLGRPRGSWEGQEVDTAYEIHHGLASPIDSAPSPIESTNPAMESAVAGARPFLDGWVSGSVWGTMWHGAFESDGFRRAWLSEIARATGSQWRPQPDAPGFAERRETMLETLADALEEHVDLDALLDLARTAREASTAAEVRPEGSIGWPPVTLLGGDVVSLRPLTADDWPTLLAEDTNAEARRWSLDPEPLDEQSARARAARGALQWSTGRAARFVIVESASGAPAGVISVVRVGPPGVAMIGYGVLPEFRGRGFTTLALRLLTVWVFAETEIVRLELGHKDGNEASGRAAVKAGFVREGRMVGRLRNPDGTFSDEIGYGLVRPGPSRSPTPPRPGVVRR